MTNRLIIILLIFLSTNVICQENLMFEDSTFKVIRYSENLDDNVEIIISNTNDTLVLSHRYDGYRFIDLKSTCGMGRILYSQMSKYVGYRSSYKLCQEDFLIAYELDSLNRISKIRVGSKEKRVETVFSFNKNLNLNSVEHYKVQHEGIGLENRCDVPILEFRKDQEIFLSAVETSFYCPIGEWTYFNLKSQISRRIVFSNFMIQVVIIYSEGQIRNKIKWNNQMEDANALKPYFKTN